MKSLLKNFTDHPKCANQTYFEHARFALTFACGCARASAKATVHALFPSVYITGASDEVRKLNAILDDLAKRKT